MPTGFSENNGWMNTAILLSITVVCMYAVFSKVSKKLLGLEKANSRIVAALLILVMIQYVPSAFDAFYWWSGAMNSVLGFLFFLLEFDFIISLYNDSEVIKPYKWVLLGIGLFLIAGTSWSAVLVLFVCMLLVLVDMWSRKANNYKYRIPYSIIFFFYTVCILFAVSAPGNARRAGIIESELAAAAVENAWMGHPINSILRSYIEGLFLLWQSINPVIILVIGLICLILLPKLMERKLAFKYPLIMLFTTYSIYVASFVPVLYTKGGAGEARIKNIQYWYAVLFLVWNACYFLGWYLQKKKVQKEWKLLHEHKVGVIFLGLIICFSIMLTGEREPAAKIAMKDYLTGELQQFDREVDARELLLRESPEEGDLWLTRLNCVIPDIFEGYTDLQPDEARFWVNNTVREYYHLKTLHVE